MAIAGAVVRWLQDNLGIIGSSEELGTSEGVFLLSFCFFLFCWMGFFLCREAGGVRWHVLWLLLRSRLLRAVRSILGAQCQRVRPVPSPCCCLYPLSPDPGLCLRSRIICGLTQFTNKSHVAFAALEAVCFQTREVNEHE